MKIVTASNGNKILKLSRIEWENIGKTAGWFWEKEKPKKVEMPLEVKRKITPPQTPPQQKSQESESSPKCWVIKLVNDDFNKISRLENSDNNNVNGLTSLIEKTKQDLEKLQLYLSNIQDNEVQTCLKNITELIKQYFDNNNHSGLWKSFNELNRLYQKFNCQA